MCLGFGCESWLKKVGGWVGWRWGWGGETEILEMKYPQSRFAFEFRTHICCSECKLAKQTFIFCQIIMYNKNRVTDCTVIQCNKQMTQGRASTYLHSVIQNARFIPVFQESPPLQYLVRTNDAQQIDCRSLLLFRTSSVLHKASTPTTVQ